MLKKALLLLIVAALTAIVLGVPASAAPPQGDGDSPSSSSSTSSTSSGQTCNGVALTLVDYMTPDGIETSVPGPTYATMYHYASGGGSGEVVATVPPAGFDVAGASDTTLDAFGLPPRPSDPVEYQEWLDLVSSMSSYAPVSECQDASTQLSLQTSGATSTWAGGIDINQTYRRASAYVTTPTTFTQSCPTSYQEAAFWVGVGGYGTAGLGQVALLVDGQPTNLRAVWELFHRESDGSDAGGGAVDMTFTWLPGDKVWEYVSYGTASDGHPLWTFQLVNKSRNAATPTQRVRGWKGHSAIYYYNGGSVEFITERGTRGGQVTRLMRFTPAAHWSTMRAVSTTQSGQAQTFPYDIVRMTLDGTFNGTLLVQETDIASGAQDEAYYHC